MVIAGNLTQLRALEPADLPLLREMSNDTEIRALVVGWAWPVAAHSQGTWLTAAENNSTTKRFAVCRTDGAAIGMTGFWNLDWKNRHAETALKLMSPDVRGRGLGSDAIMTLMAYAFYEVGLQRLWTTILPFNEGSIGAYVRKCGWTVEGRSRRHIFRDGSWHDLLQVGILKEEFDDLPHAAEYRRRIFPFDAGADLAPLGS